MIHRHHALRSARRLLLAPRISIVVYDHPILFFADDFTSANAVLRHAFPQQEND